MITTQSTHPKNYTGKSGTSDVTGIVKELPLTIHFFRRTFQLLNWVNCFKRSEKAQNSKTEYSKVKSIKLTEMLCNISRIPHISHVRRDRPTPHLSLHNLANPLADRIRVNDFYSDRLVYDHQFINQITLVEHNNSLCVNRCELVALKFAINHSLGVDDLIEILQASKYCWKLENDKHNFLATKSCKEERRLVNREEHLLSTSTLLSLNLLSFLSYPTYQNIRCKFVTRKAYLQDIFSIIYYFIVESLHNSIDLRFYNSPNYANSC